MALGVPELPRRPLNPNISLPSFKTPPKVPSRQPLSLDFLPKRSVRKTVVLRNTNGVMVFAGSGGSEANALSGAKSPGRKITFRKEKESPKRSRSSNAKILKTLVPVLSRAQLRTTRAGLRPTQASAHGSTTGCCGQCRSSILSWRNPGRVPLTHRTLLRPAVSPITSGGVASDEMKATTAI